MASATGIPQEHPDTIESRADEPLLGGPGAATQKEDASILYNVFTGTASVAQIGIWVLIIFIWFNILSQPWMLFSVHPLLNSAALLLQVQASLILQPTSSARQKQTGTRFHYSIQAFSLLAFIVAFIAIEVNKGDHARFTSPHGVMGLITYILIILQALGGLAQYFFPVRILGSVARGKSMYKYHRALGYTLLILELGSIIMAMQTPFNVNYLHIPLWGVVVTSILVVAGLGARIKKHKLGI